MFKWFTRRWRAQGYYQGYLDGILQGRQQVMRSLPTIPVSIVPAPIHPRHSGDLARAYNTLHPHMPKPARLLKIPDSYTWLPTTDGHERRPRR